MNRPDVAFIAWSPIAGRPMEIAQALGGEARNFYSRGRFGKLSVLLRYVRSALDTARYLRERRPRAVIVTNPPLIPGLLAWAYARKNDARVALDSHPGGFGLQGDRVSRVLQPLHAWLARRTTATLVTDQRLAERVRAWGGRAEIVHEAPVDWASDNGHPQSGHPRPRVLFVCVFQRDEPAADVIEAARRAPELDVHVTGDLGKCPDKLREEAPANVRFTGFLSGDDYGRAVSDADVVLALTTEPSSVVRAGYEAVYAERPLVVSDWPASREVFPHALHVENSPPAILAGLRQAVSDRERLLALAPQALTLQETRWERQLEALRKHLIPTPTKRS